MSRQVVCVKEIELTKYDDEGYSTDEYFTIPKGMVFNWYEDNTHRVIGGDVYLENDELWIELTNEDFKECVKEVKDV